MPRQPRRRNANNALGESQQKSNNAIAGRYASLNPALPRIPIANPRMNTLEIDCLESPNCLSRKLTNQGRRAQVTSRKVWRYQTCASAAGFAVQSTAEARAPISAARAGTLDRLAWITSFVKRYAPIEHVTESVVIMRISARGRGTLISLSTNWPIQIGSPATWLFGIPGLPAVDQA